MTGQFGDGDQRRPRSEYESAVTVDLGGWTNDGRRLVGAAGALAERLFQSGRLYKKAGVMCPFLEGEGTAPRSSVRRLLPRAAS